MPEPGHHFPTWLLVVGGGGVAVLAAVWFFGGQSGTSANAPSQSATGDTAAGATSIDPNVSSSGLSSAASAPATDASSASSSPGVAMTMIEPVPYAPMLSASSVPAGLTIDDVNSWNALNTKLQADGILPAQGNQGSGI